MADVSRRVVGTDVYSWMTPIEGRPGQYQHNTAVRGDVIDVSAEEAERGEGLGVLADPDADELAESEESGAPGDEDDEDDDSPELKRPATVANKETWVEYRVAESEGALTAEQLDGLTKAQLQDDDLIAALRA